MVKIFISFVLFLLFTTPALAIDAYKCIVKSTAGLSGSGALGPTDFSKMALGLEFVLDKGTGRISGGLRNHNQQGQPEVLDYGSNEQAFKALTIYRPFVKVEYLYIEEFSRNELKPFMLVDGSNIFSGTCEAY